MNTLNTLSERRSIRKYQDRLVTRESIEQILRVGMSAPSSGNSQPWQFLVVEDKATLDRLSEVRGYAPMLKEASHAIIVCRDMNRKDEFVEDFWIQGCAAATENILLAVQALGLGAVWLGVYPVQEIVEGIRALFNLPENIIPFSVVSLGYPAEEIAALDRYDEARVHWNLW
jgi:nitroreductase